MKRILSLLLVVVLLTFSIIPTGALSFLSATGYVESVLCTKYMIAMNNYIVKPTITDVSIIYDLWNLHNETPMYVYTKYTSPDAIQEPYFNRFGENDEYYEYSEVTNLMYGSGITVFYGVTWYPYDEENEAFYSLDEMAQMEPRVIDWVLEYLGPDYVGKIGDADKDGVLTILDATAIQRHLAELEEMKVELIGDIDGDGELTVLDATFIQQRLAELI